MEEEVRPLFDAADGVGTASHKKHSGGVQILLIQSICCAALVLLFWLLRLCGGSAFEELRAALTAALQSNTLSETAAGIFRDRAPDTEYTVENGERVTAASTAATTEAAVTAQVTTPATAVTAQSSVHE